MWNLPGPRDWTCVPCIGRWILNHWASRKSLLFPLEHTLNRLLPATLWELFSYSKSPNQSLPTVSHLPAQPDSSWGWKWKSHSHVWLFLTPWTIHPWNSPGQNTGGDSHSLLQGIFPTQGLNPDLLHCRWILYQLSYQGINRTKCKLPRRAF